LITFFSSFCNLIGAAKILQRGRVRYRRDARPSRGCARLGGHRETKGLITPPPR